MDQFLSNLDKGYKKFNFFFSFEIVRILIFVYCKHSKHIKILLFFCFRYMDKRLSRKYKNIVIDKYSHRIMFIHNTLSLKLHVFV